MPDFYSVKLDVNQIKREIHFWNQQTSYINALHSDSIPNYIAGRKSIVGRRAPGLVNFVAAVAYYFCLALPAAFMQPGTHLLAKLVEIESASGRHL